MRRCDNPKCRGGNKNLIGRDYVGAKNIMRCGRSIVVTEEERPESLRRGGKEQRWRHLFSKLHTVHGKKSLQRKEAKKEEARRNKLLLL